MTAILKGVITAVAVALALGVAGELSADDVGRRLEQSREVAADFMASLKAELTRAMEAGGPSKAIDACQAVAPAIAQEHSKRTGWQVGRTSLRVRNPGNAPDAWEREALLSFEKRKAAGEDIARLEHYGFVEQDGRTVFRYMKAIPTAQMCLACHGSSLDPSVKATLAELYPNDQATGFSVGDIRGAFTITQPR